jgi:hypothetical protein
VNQTAFGIFTLTAAGTNGGNGRTAAWLRSHQNSDGGWGFSAGASSDADTTGAVLQGLAASGSRAGIRRGASYLRGAQRPGGGFTLNGGIINAQSTAYAVQGLVAAGVAPSGVRRGGRSPLDYLASVQAADGHYRYSASSDQTPVWVTAQALLAANGAAFPLSPVPRKAVSAPVSTPNGSGGHARAGPGAAAPRKAAEKKGAPAAPAAQPENEAAPVPLDPASSTTGDGGGGGLPAWLVVLVVLAAGGGAVWGGWVLYRRRLPANRAS